MTEGWQNNLYVTSSPIHGMGVFARRAFATGETILAREERSVTPDEPLNAGEFEYHCDWLEGRRQVYLGFPERFVNHSCDSNAFVRFSGGPGQLIALRPIRPGEEITDNYSVNLWPASRGPATAARRAAWARCRATSSNCPSPCASSYSRCWRNGSSRSITTPTRPFCARQGWIRS